MDREIKFRGWYTTQKRMISCEEMVRDQLTLLPDGRFINVNGKHVSLSTIYPPDKFIPLQYTGLKDKQGREIYEGDIAKVERWKQKGVVVHRTGMFKVELPNKTLSLATFMGDVKCEIIGNIYENKNLLATGEAL